MEYVLKKNSLSLKYSLSNLEDFNLPLFPLVPHDGLLLVTNCLDLVSGYPLAVLTPCVNEYKHVTAARNGSGYGTLHTCTRKSSRVNDSFVFYARGPILYVF